MCFVGSNFDLKMAHRMLSHSSTKQTIDEIIFAHKKKSEKEIF